MSLIVASSVKGIPFPERNEAVRAKWCPVYIEPMIGSGERVCIGVVVISNTESLVVPVVALNRLECLYGSDVKSILFAADIVVADLRVAVSRSDINGLEGWQSPVEGILLGKLKDSYGQSIEAIARSALMMSASLVERLCESEDELTASNDRLSGNRLEDLIKERVVQTNSNLANMFGKQRRRNVNMRPVTIGFVGNVIVANFGVLTPQYLSANVKDIKSKLWDLANIRDDFEDNQLLQSTVSRFEMLFYRPSDDAPEYSTRQINNLNEAVNELEGEGDSKEIRCRASFNYETIAQTLLEAEAA